MILSDPAKSKRREIKEMKKDLLGKVISTTSVLAMLIALCSNSIFALAASANTYDVGPGQPYTRISDVPWSTLGAGSTVRIHYRQEPYHEKFVISTSGTEDQPIRIIGVKGPNSEMPCIDGENAVSVSSDYFAADLNDYSLILIAPRPGYTWGYKPKNIVIDGLELKNTDSQYSYSMDGTSQKNYYKFSCAIYGERIENLTVKNCSIHDNSIGVFVNSKFCEEQESRNILIEGNRFYNNGVSGDFSEHNTYIEAIGAVYQYNYYGTLRDGALGSSLKDRSAGTVIRYNYIEACQRAIDLVEPEASTGITDLDPSYKQSYVYGNVLYNGPGLHYSALLIHYGGDRGLPEHYRNGTLCFYNNTVLNISDQLGAYGRYGTKLFDVTDNLGTVDARNNIFYNASYTPGSVPSEMGFMRASEEGRDGNIRFGVNWVSLGWVAAPTPYGRDWNGTVTGTENFISNAENNPGFTDLVNKDYTLTAQSPCIDKAEALAGISSAYLVTKQYSSDPAGAIRQQTGSAMDLGAYEYAGATSPTTETTLPATTTTSTVPAATTSTTTATTQDAAPTATTPTLPGEAPTISLYHNESSVKFVNSWGSIATSVSPSGGIDDSACLLFTGLDKGPYAPTPALTFGTPIDISGLQGNCKLRISMDAGVNRKVNPTRIQFNNNASVCVSVTVNNQDGFETLETDLTSIRQALGDNITAYPLKAPVQADGAAHRAF